MSSPRAKRLVQLASFAACLLAAAIIREGPATAVDSAIVWLPTGVAIAGLMLLGLRAWWLVALVTIAQRKLLGYSLGVCLPAALGSTAEAVSGAFVLQRLGFKREFSRLRDAGAMLAAAAIAPIGSIVFSWIGRQLYWPYNLHFYSGWDGWWRMNALGALCVVPVAATWSTIDWRHPRPRAATLTIAAIVAVPLAMSAFLHAVPPGTIGIMCLYLMLVPLLYGAVRYGVRGATLTGALAALTVSILSTRGHGPFIDLPRELRHVALQIFELTFVAVPATFAALVAELQAASERGDRSDELRVAIQSALPDILYRLKRDGTCLDVFVPPGIEAPLPLSAFVGRSLFAFFPPERHDEIRKQVLEAFARGEAATLEYEIPVGGERRFREARLVPHGDDELLAVVRDITDRKWADATTLFEAHVLQLVATGAEAARVYAEIVSGMERLLPGAHAAVMLLSDDRLSIVLAPSMPAEYNAQLNGIPIGPKAGSCGSAAFLGTTVVIHDIATDPLWDDYRHLALPYGLRACWSIPIRGTGSRVLGTLAIYYAQPLSPDKRALALAERASALAGIVLEREQRQQALSRSEDLLASINQNVQEGLFRAAPDLSLLYANLALAKAFGCTHPQQILGRKLSDLFTDAPRHDELLRLAAEHGVWVNEEVRTLRSSGGTGWGLLSGTAVRDAQGAILHYDGVIADITERKELEEQFRQSQKMEAVGKLAGGVAHDFNNLLTVIFGYAESIRHQTQADDPSRASAEQVLEAARRASGLTRQLLAYSRQQVLSPQVLDLAAVVDQLADMLRRLIGEDVQLIVDHGPSDCWVRVDRSQLEQVLLNLVVNARDAMPGGGQLTIVTCGEGGTTNDPTLVELRVTDTGSGMSPEVQARAFDPFFTTKGPGKGTGLGLSTVYGIVQQSGGSVAIDSEMGVGTTVRITLPHVPRPATVAPAAPQAVPPSRSATVLIVEDERAVRELVHLALERAGYAVLDASEGAVALELARQHDGAIDLVITDVVMPRIGGRELASQLRAERPEQRFLFMSGYPDDARELNDLIGDRGGFLAKPFTTGDLLAAVRSVLGAPVPLH